MIRISYLFGVLVLCMSSPVTHARDGWEFSVGTGMALNQSSDADIKMNNGSDITQGSVDWDTDSFSSPFYFNFRASKWRGDTAYEFEFLRHSITVDGGLDSRVSKFELDNNLLYGNYAFLYKDSWVARGGLGLAVISPDVCVEGESSGSSYQIAGIAAQFSLEKEFPINEEYTFGIESKVTYSYNDIDLDFGSTEVTNTALHLIASIKY